MSADLAETCCCGATTNVGFDSFRKAHNICRMAWAGATASARTRRVQPDATEQTDGVPAAEEPWRSVRAERLNTLAHTAQTFAGGHLPLSVRYDIAEVMLEAFDLWEHNRGYAYRYVTPAITSPETS